jgi:hypothetical protein
LVFQNHLILQYDKGFPTEWTATRFLRPTAPDSKTWVRVTHVPEKAKQKGLVVRSADPSSRLVHAAANDIEQAGPLVQFGRAFSCSTFQGANLR